MQRFQQLIAQAFSKIDAANPQTRQKIYENIWLIQEKSLIAHGQTDAVKQEKRQQLTELLKTIEQHYRSTPQPPAPAAVSSSANAYDGAANISASPFMQGQQPQNRQAYPANPMLYQQENRRNSFDFPQETQAAAPPLMRAQEPQQNSWESYIPSVDLDETHSNANIHAERGSFYGEPQKSRSNFSANDFIDMNKPVTDNPAGYGNKKNDKKNKKRDKRQPALRKKSRIGRYMLGISSLLVILFFVGTLYSSFGTSINFHKKASNAPMRQNDYQQGGWVEVFNPANGNGRVVQSAAIPELHNDPDAKFIRITTHKTGDAAIIEIGQEALATLRGKSAVFKLIARNVANDKIEAAADNDTKGQLNLVTDFGNGTAKSYNFELPSTATPLIFPVDIPQKLNQEIKFFIGGDVEKGSEKIDVFALLLQSPGAAKR